MLEIHILRWLWTQRVSCPVVWELYLYPARLYGLPYTFSAQLDNEDAIFECRQCSSLSLLRLLLKFLLLLSQNACRPTFAITQLDCEILRRWSPGCESCRWKEWGKKESWRHLHRVDFPLTPSCLLSSLSVVGTTIWKFDFPTLVCELSSSQKQH